jgi:uncharacterized repeat protein (TIGR04138 family)
MLDRDLHCIGCNYNLRGLPWNGKCPECGKTVRETLNVIAELAPQTYHELQRAATDALAGDAGCSVDAVLFVLDAVSLAARTMHSAGAGHVTARHVCGALRAHARSYFNDEAEAIELLDEWGVRSSEDVGRIVFAAVRAGRLRASPNERQSDFAGLFTLDTLFS